MINEKLNISRQKTLLKDYHQKLLDKKAELLKDIGEMAHDDFVALLEILDKKLEKINEKKKEAKQFH